MGSSVSFSGSGVLIHRPLASAIRPVSRLLLHGSLATTRHRYAQPLVQDASPLARLCEQIPIKVVGCIELVVFRDIVSGVIIYLLNLAIGKAAGRVGIEESECKARVHFVLRSN